MPDSGDSKNTLNYESKSSRRPSVEFVDVIVGVATMLLATIFAVLLGSTFNSISVASLPIAIALFFAVLHLNGENRGILIGMISFLAIVALVVLRILIKGFL